MAAVPVGRTLLSAMRRSRMPCRRACGPRRFVGRTLLSAMWRSHMLPLSQTGRWSVADKSVRPT